MSVAHGQMPIDGALCMPAHCGGVFVEPMVAWGARGDGLFQQSARKSRSGETAHFRMQLTSMMLGRVKHLTYYWVVGCVTGPDSFSTLLLHRTLFSRLSGMSN